MGRRAAVGMVLCVIAVFDAPRAAWALNPDLFAGKIVQLLNADKNLAGRTGGGTTTVYVVARERSDATPGDVMFSLRTMQVNAKLAPRTPARCSGYVFPNEPNVAAMIAIDLDDDCVNALALTAQNRKILTISTRKDDVDPIAIAIVQQRRGDVQVYRCDYALEKEGVALAPEVADAIVPIPRRTYEATFRDGIIAEEREQWRTAAVKLQSAINLNSTEGGTVLITGMRAKKYLPHYYLGVALYHLGNCEAARSHWSESERQSQIKKGDDEYLELAELRKQRCPPDVKLGGAASAAHVEVAP